MRNHRVFVYGTLLSGQGNHKFLKDAVYVGAAYAPEATLWTLGPFPAMVLDPDSNHAVAGELYDVDITTLAQLDRLEGAGDAGWYERVTLDVTTPSGPDEAWTYVMSPLKVAAWSGAAPIPSGSWKEWSRR